MSKYQRLLMLTKHPNRTKRREKSAKNINGYNKKKDERKQN